MAATSQPQACITTYAPRLRTHNNALLIPNLPSVAVTAPQARTTKRGTTIINYAEDGFDDYDDDEDSRRRPSSLRGQRRDENITKPPAIEKTETVGKEASEPVDMPGVWRGWMTRMHTARRDLHNHAQAELPLTLMPIRIDLDIAPFIPHFSAFAIRQPNAQYRSQDLTVPYRLRDWFLWNLHETMISTDQFAACLVQDLDLPMRDGAIAEISKQIRTQLEEYSAAALHPLFQSPQQQQQQQQKQKQQLLLQKQRQKQTARDRHPVTGTTTTGTPTPTPATPTPIISTHVNRPGETPTLSGRTTCGAALISATASIPPEGDGAGGISGSDVDDDDLNNPDDAYRCIINLNISLGSQVFTDRFEWSLLHPPGTAEQFARITCADLGLGSEWAAAMTHAIYEAVLRLKKEACESGSGHASSWGMTALGPSGSGSALPNNAAPSGGGDGAGWRYDSDLLGEEWEPRLETLSKEELEKRELDRERQIRRLRRETARFGSVAASSSSAAAASAYEVIEEERMGRGERMRRKRRQRSGSPAGTPGLRGTPDVGVTTDSDRAAWRCCHCKTWGTSTWAFRDGPHGPKTLCDNCSHVYESYGELPMFAKDLHLHDVHHT